MDKFTSMINKQELRIGNWVSIPKQPYYDEDQTGFRQVADIDSEGINYLDHGSRGVFLKDIEPIPITPEILEKVGLGKSELAAVKWYLAGWKDEEGGRLAYHKEGKTNIEHVHQLQNLYYALTGQELELHL